MRFLRYRFTIARISVAVNMDNLTIVRNCQRQPGNTLNLHLRSDKAIQHAKVERCTGCGGICTAAQAQIKDADE